MNVMESSKMLVKMLNERNIPYTYNEYPGLGHYYPSDFANQISSFVTRE
ncbi:MAG: hypothetical protein ACTSRU_09145 [Candidatus Hodarchaeales archaeon]